MTSRNSIIVYQMSCLQKPKPKRIVGVAEVAEMANVTGASVSNWRNRYEDFPKPIEVLASGPVWRRITIAKWLSKPRKERVLIKKTHFPLD